MASLARVKPTDAIAVAGPHGLDTVMALCRGGYLHVVCACGARLRTSGEPNDVVMVGGPLPDPDLAATVERASHLMGEHGALVVRLADIDQDRVVEAALLHAGLEIGSTVYDLSAEVLVSHVLHRRPTYVRAA